MAEATKFIFNGIPALGLGTYPLHGTEAADAVRMATGIGFRHIDTAQMYGNEAAVGQAIATCGVPRHELFVVTKVDPGNITAARFAGSVKKSIEDLGGPVDLLLIHWPPANAEIDEAVDRLLAAKADGFSKAVGVSNFSPGMMRRAQARAKGVIINNQVEFHPLLDQTALQAAAKETGMVLSAYSPLGRGAALKPEAVKKVAAKLGRPPSEIVLRWIVQQGVAAIPMTTKRENALSNLRALEFQLSEAEMAAISAIGTREGRLIDPGWMKGRWDD